MRSITFEILGNGSESGNARLPRSPGSKTKPCRANLNPFCKPPLKYSHILAHKATHPRPRACPWIARLMRPSQCSPHPAIRPSETRNHHGHISFERRGERERKGARGEKLDVVLSCEWAPPLQETACFPTPVGTGTDVHPLCPPSPRVVPVCPSVQNSQCCSAQLDLARVWCLSVTTAPYPETPHSVATRREPVIASQIAGKYGQL